MSSNLWPTRTDTGFRLLDELRRFVVRRSTLLSVGKVSLLALLYVLGTRATLPTLAVGAESNRVGDWWFVELFDLLLTGGAFENAALFSSGVLASVILSGRLGLLLRLGLLGLLSALLTGIYLVRGLLVTETQPVVATIALIFLGGLLLWQINRMLARQWGPQILHLNVLLLAIVHLEHLFGLEPVLGGVLLLLLGVSSVVVVRHRERVELVNIKAPPFRRRISMVLPGVNENTLDAIALICLSLFVCLGFLVSIVAGWSQVDTDNWFGFVVVAAVVFGATGALVVLVEKVLNASNWFFATVRQLVEIGHHTGIRDPRRFAEDLIQNFWIIPGIRAGEATEEYIRARTRHVLRRSFALIVAWTVLCIGVEVLSWLRGSDTVLFPYGPLIFVGLFVTLFAYVAMVTRELHFQFRYALDQSRGQFRLARETVPEAVRSISRALDNGAPPQELWHEDRLGGQAQEIVDWIRLVRVLDGRHQRPEREWRSVALAAAANLIISFLFGTFTAFVGGFLYLLFVPTGDPFAIAVPLFVGGALSPSLLLGHLRPPTGNKGGHEPPSKGD